jgi:2-phospho-L-lactate guanylyltransferase
MTTWAILPVKPLHQSKRRLEHLLSAEERAGLIGRFLDNLLAALNTTPSVDHVLVVTGDSAVAALARERGASILVEAAPAGLNAAAARGVAMAAAEGATAVLLLPADLPFARIEDVEAMLQPLTGDGRPLMAICGDEAEEGTNALLLAPPGDFTFRYGPGSFRAHLAEAEAHGRAVHVVPAPGLRCDLDTESDGFMYQGFLVGVGEE